MYSHILNVLKDLLNGQGDDARLLICPHHCECLATGGLPIGQHRAWRDRERESVRERERSESCARVCESLTIESLHHRVDDGSDDGTVNLVSGGFLSKHMVYRSQQHHK